MTRQYEIDENEIISYEENGVRYSFMKDDANPYYQAYLRWLENPDADESGTL